MTCGAALTALGALGGRLVTFEGRFARDECADALEARWVPQSTGKGGALLCEPWTTVIKARDSPSGASWAPRSHHHRRRRRCSCEHWPPWRPARRPADELPPLGSGSDEGAGEMKELLAYVS